MTSYKSLDKQTLCAAEELILDFCRKKSLDLGFADEEVLFEWHD